MHELILKDYLVSRAVAQRLRAEPYRCWRNALLAVVCQQAQTYVEGWVVLPRRAGVEIIEHGWSCNEERIVDPSLVLVELPTQPAFYFPGWQLARDEFLERVSGKVLPLVAHLDYGADGMGHQGYKQAYEAAWELARKLTQERYLSLETITVRGRMARMGLTIALH